MTIRSVTRLLLVCAAVCTTGCGEDNAGVAPQEPALRPVKSLVVGATDTARVRSFAGRSQSTRQSRLSFNVGGKLTALEVAVGDRLAAGQLIASIDPASYELQVQQAQAALAQARATERNAEVSYQRTRDLYENNNASRNDLDAARAGAESARAQTSAASKSLELARLNLSYTTLHAQSGCVVADVIAEVNENVQAGTPIVEVACGEGIEVEVSVPESVISRIRLDMQATVNFSAQPGNTYPGRVSEVGITAAEGAAYPVTITLGGDTSGVRPGMAADVSFSLAGAGQAAIVVPVAAVSEDSRGRFVYVAAATGNPDQAVVSRREVSVGELTEAGIVILEGLDPGERVVTAGVRAMRDGLNVLIR
ncbi:MAG: efflux RND transporter periplasmic adaptor subunit [Gammaproteobacteria bacterium]|jgi:RND family efflux transporter MFP subunit